MITSFSSLLLPPWAEERVTDIQFYFIVLIDIFYYGRGLGHTFGVRVDGTSSRRFLRFLSLTGLLAPRVVVSPYRAMSIKSALRDWLSVSYGMISTLVISRYARLPLSDCAGLLHGKGGGAATKGGNAEMVPEVYDSLFFPHIPRFPLRWQGNWIHRGEKRPANPVTRFPVGEMPRRGKRVYKVEHRSGTPSLSRPPIGGLCHLGFLPLDMPAV